VIELESEKIERDTEREKERERGRERENGHRMKD
jgi:hypothetical protein